jgi:hypothetical protein
MGRGSSGWWRWLVAAYLSPLLALAPTLLGGTPSTGQRAGCGAVKATRWGRGPIVVVLNRLLGH